MRHGDATRFEIDVEEGHSDGVRRNLQLLSTTGVCCSSVLPKLLPLCCQVLCLMAPMRTSRDLFAADSVDALSAGALGFMPRLLVLTTLPHRRPDCHRFERVNGRHTLRLFAPRRIGLPYGSYPRLILAWLTSEAVRTRNPEIALGTSPSDLARKLGLSTFERSTISNPPPWPLTSTLGLPTG